MYDLFGLFDISNIYLFFISFQVADSRDDGADEEDEGINTMTPPKTPAEDYSKQVHQYGDQMESTTTL